MGLLVLNAGSSTLKFGLFADDTSTELAAGQVDWRASGTHADLVLRVPGQADVRRSLEVTDHSAAVAAAVHALAERFPSADIRAIGHRIVHGGTVFRDSVQIDERVKAEIERLAELAPLHNPPALAALGAVERALPGRPHVAVFDTAFFAALPPHAHVYPLPYDWYTQWGVRRFGFHGISHAYCAGRAAELLPDQSRLVICHLGNGCSASAVRAGAAVATTMGFTPLEGLMMGSRPGSIDAGILLHLQRRHGLGLDDLEHALNHDSGLKGVSGVSSDFRAVSEAARQGHERARLALDIYADRVRATIGALAATLGGLDAIVFTAGVGENSSDLRAAACAGLEFLGVALDPARNAGCQADADVAARDSRVRVLVLHTREELLIARETRRLSSK